MSFVARAETPRPVLVALCPFCKAPAALCTLSSCDNERLVTGIWANGAWVILKEENQNADSPA
jgi:hypothetical protein